MRHGLLLGGAAYALWGASALYWPLLLPASATEILAVRVIFSFLALAVLIGLLGRWRAVHRLLCQPRQRWILSTAALLIAVNWGTFIYATTSGRVIEASLGYFISPLIMVCLGVLIFGERPRTRQWVAAALGGTGLLVLIAAHGRFPWIAAVLAVTFGLYAMLKKRSGARAVDSLTVETTVLLLPALGYAVALQLAGTAHFGHVSATHTALMVGASLVMLVPLLLFGAAANRAPLSSVGLLQYLEPVVQFLIGVLIFAESMPLPRWLAFLLVWAAIAVLLTDRRRTGRAPRSGLSSGAPPELRVAPGRRGPPPPDRPRS